MSSNKTISINPSLFSVSSKTKKREKKSKKANIVPLISPNILKNKLLKRIKEHKQKETQHLINKKELNIDTSSISHNKELQDFNDEFTDSINYLQTLSKQTKIDYEKAKKREELEKKTLRSYNSTKNYEESPIINIELPKELELDNIRPVIDEPIKINTPYKGDHIPYGVLKGGTKPTYKEWRKTQKNNIVTDPQSSIVIEGDKISSVKSNRENRLNQLREKIKQKNIQEDVMITEKLIKKPMIDITNTDNSDEHAFDININRQHINNENTNNENINNQKGGKIIATKHITKKTIKRKYTLGRSQVKRKVGILIKDRATRKKVIEAQKDLRRKNINDIKGYLRQHNIIKAGSNAPNDVIRQMYESSMLAGEITNNNKESLLHNFTKSE